MRRSEITELHYLTPIANLPSILRSGLLSHKLAASIKSASSIANPDVQARRSVKKVPMGRPLHEYVNLYVNGRNPMLYWQMGTMGTVCVLQVNVGVLDLPGVVITDRNAATQNARF